MRARRYRVRFNGLTPLLMHADNLDMADKLEAWRKDSKNKSLSKAGDDRSPAWTWMAYLYIENGKVVIPADCIMGLFREAGSRVSTGRKGQRSYKSLSQTGILLESPSWSIAGAKGEVFEKDFADLVVEQEHKFDLHKSRAAKLGFALWPKRAKVGEAKHVRVRPRFDVWTVEGVLTLCDDGIDEKAFADILEIAGNQCGLGDWRPSAKKGPGSWGRFKADFERL